MPSNALNVSLERGAREHGAAFFGVAELDGLREGFEQVWPLSLAGMRFGISVGMRLNDWIVDRLSATPDPAIAKLYWHHAYAVVNAQLDTIVLLLATALQQEGFQAVPVSATVKVDAEELLGPFTHKAVSRLAGLGWIGKSCLLVTPQAGPRVRWATVLTDAPLVPTGHAMERRCGDCRICVDACPVHAFTGRPFDPNEPVALRFDVRKCQAHLKAAPSCGLCLASCPHGKPPRSKGGAHRDERH